MGENRFLPHFAKAFYKGVTWLSCCFFPSLKKAGYMHITTHTIPAAEALTFYQLSSFVNY
jgi:hypothetical protein